MTFGIETLEAAHKRSGPNRDEVLASDVCGCFYCLATFPPAEIDTWVNDESYATCPKCSIDSVIGNKSGYPVTDPIFLQAMYNHWFERTVHVENQ